MDCHTGQVKASATRDRAVGLSTNLAWEPEDVCRIAADRIGRLGFQSQVLLSGWCELGCAGNALGQGINLIEIEQMWGRQKGRGHNQTRSFQVWGAQGAALHKAR